MGKYIFIDVWLILLTSTMHDECNCKIGLNPQLAIYVGTILYIHTVYYILYILYYRYEIKKTHIYVVWCRPGNQRGKSKVQKAERGIWLWWKAGIINQGNFRVVLQGTGFQSKWKIITRVLTFYSSYLTNFFYNLDFSFF